MEVSKALYYNEFRVMRIYGDDILMTKAMKTTDN